MFSHPGDTHDIVAARLEEVNAISGWIAEYSEALRRERQEEAAAGEGTLV